MPPVRKTRTVDDLSAGFGHGRWATLGVFELGSRGTLRLISATGEGRLGRTLCGLMGMSWRLVIGHAEAPSGEGECRRAPERGRLD